MIPPCCADVSFLITHRPTRSTLFPYTTLFRSPFTAGVLVLSLVLPKTYDATARLVVESEPGPLAGGDNDSMTRRLATIDRKSTRLNSSHGYISYAVFCLKKKTTIEYTSSHSSP